MIFYVLKAVNVIIELSTAFFDNKYIQGGILIADLPRRNYSIVRPFKWRTNIEIAFEH